MRRFADVARLPSEWGRHTPMNLVVFDIDDTLTHTMDVDMECFVQAVDDLLQVDLRGFSWDEFPDITDTGILNVIYERRRGRLPTSTETRRFVNYFATLLEDCHQVDASRFRPVPGSQRLLAALGARNDWAVALATGAWRQTAEFKLRAADLFDDVVPLATSDDHHTRIEIFKTGVARAEAAAGISGFQRVVAVGDGPWDVATARALQVGFIGVGSEDKLRRIGASDGMEDFQDLERFYELLESASTP